MRHLFLSLVLLPAFVFAQTTPPPAGPQRWEKDIAAFEKADRDNPPEKGGIVFVGSSSIRLWTTLAQDFPQHRVLNRGFGGSQMPDSVHFADRIVLPYEPRMVVVYAGGNDINAKRTPEQVAADFRTFVEKVRAKLPATEIAYISIAGNPARWAQVEQVKAANAMIEQYCRETPGLKFINVFPHMLGPDGLPRPEIFREDRLHMNAEGYRLWTRIVRDYLPSPDKEAAVTPAGGQ
jgi:lysophospholipase L1-like esterase